jgi:hypothetical protein
VTYPEPAGRNADFQSAVSQNCILQSLGRLGAPARVECPADYKSAIQQIENLRYVTLFASLGTHDPPAVLRRRPADLWLGPELSAAAYGPAPEPA